MGFRRVNPWVTHGFLRPPAKPSVLPRRNEGCVSLRPPVNNDVRAIQINKGSKHSLPELNCVTIPSANRSQYFRLPARKPISFPLLAVRPKSDHVNWRLLSTKKSDQKARLPVVQKVRLNYHFSPLHSAFPWRTPSPSSRSVRRSLERSRFHQHYRLPLELEQCCYIQSLPIFHTDLVF